VDVGEHLLAGVQLEARGDRDGFAVLPELLVRLVLLFLAVRLGRDLGCRVLGLGALRLRGLRLAGLVRLGLRFRFRFGLIFGCVLRLGLVLRLALDL
jgi:hypothetical protein